MGYEYNGLGFFAHLVFFFAAGMLGRYRTWWGISIPTLLIPCLTLLYSTHPFDVVGSVLSGFLTGACGAVIIPLFWAGRKGSASSGVHFVEIGGPRGNGHYMVFKGDNHPDDQTGRKPWTENR